MVINSNLKLFWDLNCWGSKGIHGFTNFTNELDFLQSMEIQRNLGLELGVTETHGSSLYYGDSGEFRIRIEVQGEPRVHEFQNIIDPSTSCEKFRNRIEVQGVAPHEMDPPDTMEIQRNLGLELGVKGIQCSDRRGCAPAPHPPAATSSPVSGARPQVRSGRPQPLRT